MKLLNLKVEGFRSLRHVTWEPGDLNVLIGPNAGGKSNLLRILELLSISAQHGLSKHIQKEGGMGALVWDGRAEDICVRILTAPAEDDHELGRDNFAYGLRLDRIGTSAGYTVGWEELGAGEKVFLHRSDNKASVTSVRNEKSDVGLESLEGEALLSTFSLPWHENPVLGAFRSRMASWGVYQDFDTGRDSPVRRGSVARTEKRVGSDGENLVCVLHTLYTQDREFKQEIDDAMRAAFGPDFEGLIFPPEADQRIQLRVAWKSLKRPQSAADLSDGTLRFLFLLAILANPDPPALIAIDEPETGLHPSMLPIIAEYGADASTRTQVVFASHSPEFLDSFRETIPTTTVVECRDGETRIRNLSGDALSSWLKEYSLGEILRSSEAEIIE